MPRPAAFLLPLAALLGACSTQRTITILSDPPGATVWMDGKDRGTTPVTLPFVYYGDAEVRLEKEGYQSIAAVLEIPTQIDGYPYVDLPFELTVRHRGFQWRATLPPLAREHPKPEVAALLDRAKTFRERTRREADPSELRAPPPEDRSPAPRARPVEEPPPLVRPVRGG